VHPITQPQCTQCLSYVCVVEIIMLIPVQCACDVPVGASDRDAETVTIHVKLSVACCSTLMMHRPMQEMELALAVIELCGGSAQPAFGDRSGGWFVCA
jgi:hypothetical protein